MTTISGKVYLSTEIGEGAVVGVAELVKTIVDKCKQRDKEMAAEHARREAESVKQFELLSKLVEGTAVS
jgi:DNA-binding GntR family transcriptional regulator